MQSVDGDVVGVFFFQAEDGIRGGTVTGVQTCALPIYPIAWGKEAVEARLASLCAQAEDAVRAGYSIIVISDRLVERERVAIPALLASSAIHQHLVVKGLRTSAGLVVETGSVREVHHFALLGGYGAEAAKSICGHPTRSRSCSTRRGRIRPRHTRNTRRSSTTSPGVT